MKKLISRCSEWSRKKKILLSALFALCVVGAIVGISLFRGSQGEQKVEAYDENFLTVGNNGSVITYDSTNKLKKDRDYDYGTDANPYIILEIVPNMELAWYGYLVAGCEPVDMEAIKKNDPNSGPGSFGYFESAIDYAVPKDDNGNYWSANYMKDVDFPDGEEPTGTFDYPRDLGEQVGYLTKAKNNSGDSAVVSSKRSYTQNNDGKYIVTFRPQQSGDKASAQRYSVASAKEITGWYGAEYYYSKDANGKYQPQKAPITDSSNAYEVVFQPSPTGEYVVDVAIDFTNQWNSQVNRYDRTETKFDSYDDTKGDFVSIIHSDNGEYQWHLDPDADLSKVNTDWTSFKNGTSDKYYTTRHYTRYRVTTFDYQHLNKFLLESIGLAKGTDINGDTYDISFATTCKEFTKLTDAQKRQFGWNGESFDMKKIEKCEDTSPYMYRYYLYKQKHNNIKVKVKTADGEKVMSLKERIETFNIQIKTITSEDLNADSLKVSDKYDGWINSADYIFMSDSIPNGRSADWFYKYNVYGMKKADNKLSDREHFTGEADLNWEACDLIFNVTSESRRYGAAFIFNIITMADNIIGKAPTASINTREYCFATRTLTRHYHTGSPRTGYLNNTYKLFVLLSCMDHDAMDTYYYLPGLIKKKKVTVDGRTFTTGVCSVQPGEKEQIYWDGLTFLPCFDDGTAANTDKSRPNDYGTVGDWQAPGILYQKYKTNPGGSSLNSGKTYINGRVMMTPGGMGFTAGWTWGNLTNLDKNYAGNENHIADYITDLDKATNASWQNYIIKYPGDTRVSSTDPRNILDIEPSDNALSDEEKTAREAELWKLFGATDGKSKLDIYYISPEALNGKTDDFYNQFDMVIIGLDADGLDGITSKNEDGERYTYSHVGVSVGNNKYPGNDITVRTMKHLQNYVNAGRPMIIWDYSTIEFDNEDYVYVFDEKKNKDSKGNSVILVDRDYNTKKKASECKVNTDLVDPKSNMYHFLSTVDYFDYRDAYKTYREKVEDADLDDEDKQDKNEQTATSKQVIKSSVARLRDIYKVESLYTASKFYDALYGVTKEDAQNDEENSYAMNRTERKRYKAVFDAFLGRMVPDIPTIVFASTGKGEKAKITGKPNSYTSATGITETKLFEKSDSVENADGERKYASLSLEDAVSLEDGVITDIAKELKFTFSLNGGFNEGKPKYRADCYIDMNADGVYAEDELFWTKEITKEDEEVSFGYSDLAGADATSITNASKHKKYLDSLKGPMYWKIMITKEAASAKEKEVPVTSEQDICLVNTKEVKKKTLHILQIVPDKASSLNMEKANTKTEDDSWIYDYTKDLVDFNFAIYTLTTKEFESLYDPNITKFTKKIRVEKATNPKQMITYTIKDNNKLTYTIDNENTDRLGAYDLIVIGLSQKQIGNISNAYGAVDNLINYINAGNSVLFTSGTLDTTETTGAASDIVIPANVSNPYTEEILQKIYDENAAQNSQEPVEQGSASVANLLDNLVAAAGAGKTTKALGQPDTPTPQPTPASQPTPDASEGGATSTPAPTSAAVPTPGAQAGNTLTHNGGYLWNKFFRNMLGADRYGRRAKDVELFYSLTTGFKYDTDDVDGNTTGYTYRTVAAADGATMPFQKMDGSGTETQYARITNLKGQITTYPYYIENEYVTSKNENAYGYPTLQQAREDGFNSTVFNDVAFGVEKSQAQPYELYMEDFSSNGDGYHNSWKTDDSAAAPTAKPSDALIKKTDTESLVVWATLEGTESHKKSANAAKDMYGVSSEDASNNYYLYTKGNTGYIGISQKLINSDGELDSDHTKTDMERKLFINALIAIYCKAKNVTIQVPDAVEVYQDDHYYSLDFEDIAEIDNFTDDDTEMIVFQVTDSKSDTFDATVKYSGDGDNAFGGYAYPVQAYKDMNPTEDGVKPLTLDEVIAKYDPVPLEIYKVEPILAKDADGDGELDRDASGNLIHYDDGDLATDTNGKLAIHTTGSLKPSLVKPKKTTAAEDVVIPGASKSEKLSKFTYEFVNGEYYAVKYRKYLVKDTKKKKLIITATNADDYRAIANISVIAKGLFQLK